MSEPPWPRERTVVIGDTPRDIACARADRVRVVAVATGPFAIEALADADAVADDARALLPVLSDWAS
jgi:phosphoglycolate phosphatase-like HAD superfamily hydrolase